MIFLFKEIHVSNELSCNDFGIELSADELEQDFDDSVEATDVSQNIKDCLSGDMMFIHL